MIALLIFAYACCALGVWFGWYLRGRYGRYRLFGKSGRVNQDGSVTWTFEWSHKEPAAVYGDSPRTRQNRAAQILTEAQDSTE